MTVSTLVASFAFTSLVFARSIDQTPVIATLTGVEHNVQSVSVLADGRLQILDLGGQLKTAQLSPAALENLKSLALGLADAELEIVESEIVCMMLPVPELSDLSVAKFDWQTETWSQQLTLVHTQVNCAIPRKVFPKLDWMREQARELRAAIKILALNELK